MTTTTSASVLADLEPAAIWRFFSGLAAVPRPSKREARIRRHVLEVAEEHGLSAREDAVGNVIIQVPASPGCESAPITVLQAHLDMVCEKNADTIFDFEREPIRLIMDYDPAGLSIVRADGTTLGADNGIGVSMALAVATSGDVVHGPLELLFTLDEESGMTGAKGLTPEVLSGRCLLNLDSEEDDAIYIGCAGGCDITLTFRFDSTPVDPSAECCHVSISGLRGGHSGGDIHEGRANAIKLLARTLAEVRPGELSVGFLGGGRVRNAIPREAEAIVCGPAGTLFELEEAANRVRRDAARESVEPDVTIHVEPAKHEQPDTLIGGSDGCRLVSALLALPDGVLGMHPKVPGLVETSNNIATIRFVRDVADGGIQVEIAALSRSSSPSRLKEISGQIASVAALSGARVEVGNDYPGWDPNPESAVLATCREVYEELFGKEPDVKAIHAGLECGLIAQRVGGMDMVSFGPRIEGAHSPDERVYVESVAKMWGFLKSVLAKLARD